MAFAARLSKRFYDRLGEDIVNEQSAVIEKGLAEHADRIDPRLRDHGRMMIGAWGVLMASLVAQ